MLKKTFIQCIKEDFLLRKMNKALIRANMLGLTLSSEEYAFLIERIKGNTRLISSRKITPTRTLYCLLYKGKVLCVLLHRNRKYMLNVFNKNLEDTPNITLSKGWDFVRKISHTKSVFYSDYEKTYALYCKRVGVFVALSQRDDIIFKGQGSHIARRAAQVNHAQARAVERYGISLNKEDLESIKSCILEKTAFYCKNVKEGAELWRVPFKDIVLYVVFDPIKNRIKTFLHKNKASPKNRDIRKLSIKNKAYKRDRLDLFNVIQEYL